ncbi:MAG: protein kinase [Planctomycetes bacterium]|nr:protein kinase [Planctomycetota bacterium]
MPRGRDIKFGQIALKMGLLSARDLSDAMLELASRRAHGESALSLGKLLVDGRRLSPGDARAVLAAQEREMLRCVTPGCARRYHVREIDPNKTYRCARCGGSLSIPALEPAGEPSPPPLPRGPEPAGGVNVSAEGAAFDLGTAVIFDFDMEEDDFAGALADVLGDADAPAASPSPPRAAPVPLATLADSAATLPPPPPAPPAAPPEPTPSPPRSAPPPTPSPAAARGAEPAQPLDGSSARLYVPPGASVLASLRDQYGVAPGVDLNPGDGRDRTALTAPRAADGDPLGADESGGPAVLGRYMVVGEIARGGMGAVMEAKDLDLRREVAVKVMLKVPGDRADVVARFVEEAQVQGQLEHPNICPVHEIGIDPSGRPFFAMKRVRGKPLKDSIADYHRGGKTTLMRLIDAFLKVCDAIAFAHSRGVIHRDLKPQNVMAGEFGEVQVMDWGLAKVLGREDRREKRLQVDTAGVRGGSGALMTMDGAIVGTPAYMPPEQARGDVRKMSERSDIYSLGAILYEILTGVPPFQGGTYQILVDVAQGKLTPPTVRAERAASAASAAATEAAGEEERRREDRRARPGSGPSGMERRSGADRRAAGSRPPARPIPRELEAVVLKAMARKQEHRYRSVNDLRADIEAWTEGRALRAVEYSALELFQKWVRRNRAIVIPTAVATTVLLVAGVWFVSSTVSKNREVARQRDQAEEARGEAAHDRDQARDAAARAERNEHEARAARETSERDREQAQAERARAEQALTAANVNLCDALVSKANLALADADILSAMVYLDGARERGDTRALRDALLCIAEPPAVYERTLSGHDDFVRCAAFSPDGATLVTGSSDKTIRVSEVPSGRPLRTLLGHLKGVAALAFAPDGKTFASGGDDQTVRLWDAATGRELQALSGHEGSVNAVAWSRDGSLLASAGEDKTARLWRGGDTVRVISGHEASIQAVAFSPDGKVLATAGVDNTIRLSDPATGETIRVIAAHTLPVLAVAFSPDGKFFFSGSAECLVFQWDTSTWQVVRAMQGHRGPILSICVSPDSNYVLTGSWDRTLRGWETITGRNVMTLSGHSAPVLAVASSPSFDYFASAGWDRTARLWKVMRSSRTHVLTGHERGVNAAAFSPDGTLVASAGEDGTLRVWEESASRERAKAVAHQGEAAGLCWSPDGRTLASCGHDGAVRLWDAATLESKAAWAPGGGAVFDVRWSPDGRTLAAAGEDGAIRLIDAASGAVGRTLTGHTSAVVALAFGAGGRLLASGGADRQVTLWDPRTGEKRWSNLDHSAGVSVVAFTPDGEAVVSGGRDWTIRLFEAGTGRPRRTLYGNVNTVHALAFSPDGRTLVSGSSDAMIRLWEMATGREIRVISAQMSGVTSLSFSPDGRRLASAAKDGSIVIWGSNMPATRAEVVRLAGLRLENLEAVPFTSEAEPGKK